MFTLLTKGDCVWCDKAKQLLDERKAPYGAFHYKDHFMIPILMRQANLKTVPQVWVDTPNGITYIGGYEDLVNWFKNQNVWNAT